MQTLAISWPLLLLLALSLPLVCLGTWLLKLHANRQRESGTPPFTMSDAARVNAEAIRRGIGRTVMIISTNQTIKFALVFLLSGAFWLPLGYYYHDHVMLANIFTREDLDVREVYPAGNAKMQERKSGDIVYVNPCSESPTPFIPGMHVTKIRYAQLAGCKLVKYYDYDMRPDGRALLTGGEVANVR